MPCSHHAVLARLFPSIPDQELVLWCSGLDLGLQKLAWLILASSFFSPLFIYFFPLHFNSISWEIPAEIYSLLRCFFSLVWWMLGLV